MHLLINNTFEIAKGIYQPPSTNATGIYFAKNDTHLKLKIRPDDETYAKVYGTGGYNSNLLYLYFIQSANADLSGGQAIHQATWTGASGNFAFETDLNVAKGNYFNLYFVYNYIWQHHYRTSYRDKVYRIYGWEYTTRWRDHYEHRSEIHTNIDIKNFEFVLENS